MSDAASEDDAREGTGAAGVPAADGPVRVAFVCVQNAGRSQMAAALAARELRRRGAEDRIEVRTGGTDPADAVHPVVVEAMAEVAVDLSGATPRAITRAELLDVDYVVTMGCSADDVCPNTWRGDARDWGLDDPHGLDLPAVREIRAEIDERVGALLDELLGDADGADGAGGADAETDGRGPDHDDGDERTDHPGDA